MAFTDAKIRALKLGKKRSIEWGDDGLGIRVGEKRKSWVYMYRFNGKPRMMTLGAYPVMGVADANLKRSEAQKLLEDGFDPGSGLVAARKANREAMTVSELVEEYLEKWARPRKRSAKEDERMLRKDVIPAWGDRKAKDIKRRDILTLLDSILERGATTTANRTLAVIRKMFKFAVGRDILDASPCHDIHAPVPENQRDRILTDEEIRAFWLGLDNAGMTHGVRLALRLLLVTAQRKSEVVSAPKSEFDLNAKVWTIPADRAKNKLAHRIPLSPMALEIIHEAIAAAGDSPWLFPSPFKDKPIIPTAVDHALRKNLPKLGLENLCPHDLRRTAASLITGLGFNRLIVSKILNHVERGATAVYDRHGYDDEKRMALDAWSRKLESIINGENMAKVIPFVKGA
ncbi:MAG: tyrosine-type recombinase/integrase [Nitrospinae bacterium]|nr:tyrosine-type recombinase/integrase [Nitrospinota bacterium]